MPDNPTPSTPTSERLLEVIVSSRQEAVQAEQAGAARLELVRELACGGVTPHFGIIDEVLSCVSTPVRIMLRNRTDLAAGSAEEVEQLCETARRLSSLPSCGLVLGFASSGQLDLGNTRRVLDCAPHLRATFHHAFEATADPFDTIRQLKELPQIDRILTYGGQGSWTEKLRRLEQFELAARPEMHVLVGGGLTEEVIGELLSSPYLQEFHVGRCVRTPETPEGKLDGRKLAVIAELLNSPRSPR